MAETSHAMNVLMVTCWYPDQDSPATGTFVREHARAIHRFSGVSLCVLHVRVGDIRGGIRCVKETDETGFPVHHLTIASRFPKALYSASPILARTVARWSRRVLFPGFRPDLVHAQVIHPAGVIGNQIAENLQVPLVISEHWSKASTYFSRPLFGWPGRTAMRMASATSAVSEFLAGSIQKWAPEPAALIPNVVDDSVFFPATSAMKNSLVFVCVAHWSSPKRPDLIFRSINRVATETGKTIDLHVVGEGPLLDALREQTWRFRVHYHGIINSRALADLLRQSTALLHASEMETFSVVVAEAICCGLPVVASRVGALPEVMRNAQGAVVDNTDEGWYNAVLKMTTDAKPITPTEHFVNPWSAEKIGKQFTATYQDAIARFKAR